MVLLEVRVIPIAQENKEGYWESNQSNGICSRCSNDGEISAIEIAKGLCVIVGWIFPYRRWRVSNAFENEAIVLREIRTIEEACF